MSNKTPGIPESEPFTVYVEAIERLVEEWKEVNLDLTQIETKFKGTDVEFLLAKIALENLRNTILLSMLEFFKRAIPIASPPENVEALKKSEATTATTLGIYMGQAARLSSVN